MDLAAFEKVEPKALKTGFFADLKSKKDSKKKVILLRAPKGVKAADLDGIKVDVNMGKSSFSSGIFTVPTADGKSVRHFALTKGIEGELAPVALVVPHSDRLAVEKGFDAVWNVSLATDAPAAGKLEVDLEDDIGGRSWKQVSQATNLREPLSAINIQMVRPDTLPSSTASFQASPVKKPAKKRKHDKQ